MQLCIGVFVSFVLRGSDVIYIIDCFLYSIYGTKLKFPEHLLTTGGLSAMFVRDEDDRRKAQRYPFPANIKYGLNGGTSPPSSKAVTMNVSRTGVCMYVFENVGEGDEITITNDHPVIKGRARVQWIKEIESSFYLAGLMYI